MKRIFSIIVVMLLALSMLALSACSKNKEPNLAGDIAEDGKSMEITANKADDGDYIVTGGIVLGEGEQIYYDHQIDKGGIEIQFIAEEEDQSIDELPDIEGDDDPAKTLELSEYGGGSAYFESGTYMVKVSATGKNTVGTVTLEVKPIEEAE